MRVSILLPVYNGDKYLSEALDCINHQTYKDIELFLYDHGSTDKTWEIIEKYNCKFPCIKKHFERSERDTKYNAYYPAIDALNNCTGDLFYTFACDDIMYEDFIFNNIIQYIGNKKMKIWHSAIFFNDDNVLKSLMYPYYNMEELKSAMLERSIINCPSVFFVTDFIKRVGFSSPKYMNCGDYELFFRIIDLGIYIYPIHKRLGMYYRFNDEQCTKKIHKLKDGYPVKELQKLYKEKWGM